ncbi:MAG: DNA primase [Deltaproteobacteria bacterium]|nr:DNA primase [Deltaproteobacteria bacterium]
MTPGGALPTLPSVIPEETVNEIRERVDLVSLVGEYVKLKKRGGNHIGLCPFHNEKTPSFNVHAARGFFHCFGCKASGDVFAFLMRIDGVSFPDAVRSLAERAGVELPVTDAREDAAQRQRKQQRESLVALMEAATGFYAKQLEQHDLAGLAREELRSREISLETAREFQLGYAPDGWDALTHFLGERGFTPAEGEAVGLIVPRRGGDGHYDRFRHRLVFPIVDLHGRVVAFSGRRLPPVGEQAAQEREPGAKYVNSPEGPLYHKGDVLYGLHRGRVAMRRQSRALVCEGNFDLVALHQAGFETAVAPMGTAFTEAQARLLKRFAQRVDLLFDGDAAGDKAVAAAHPLLAAVGLAAHVVTLPRGADPDTFLREHGAEELRQRIETAPPIVQHLIDRAAAQAAGDPHAQAEAIASLGPVLAVLGSPLEARLHVERIARKFGVRDVDAVRAQLRRGLSGARRPRRDRPAEAQDAPGPVERPRPFRAPVLERQLVGALLDAPELVTGEDAARLTELLTSEELQSIFQSIARMMEQRGQVDFAALRADFTGHSVAPWLEQRLAVPEYDAEGAERALADGVPLLSRQWVERRLSRLGAQILEAKRAGDEDLARQLMRDRVALYRQNKPVGSE